MGSQRLSTERFRNDVCRYWCFSSSDSTLSFFLLHAPFGKQFRLRLRLFGFFHLHERYGNVDRITVMIVGYMVRILSEMEGGRIVNWK